MAWQPTTRLHISGYRFMLRRIECALLGRDIRAVNEPIRAPAQSLMAGLVLGGHSAGRLRGAGPPASAASVGRRRRS